MQMYMYVMYEFVLGMSNAKILVGYANMNATLKGANEDLYSCSANVLHANANANVYACDANVCSWNV